MRTRSFFRDVFLPIARDVLILVSLGVVFAFTAIYTLSFAMQKSTVTIPVVVGQRLSEAEQVAHKAGFGLEVKGRVHSKTAEINTIVEQSPRGGMTVKEGQPIRVIVSLGSSDVGPSQPSH